MKNLKKLRKAYHMSQKDLADQFHMTQQAICKYEKGSTEPNIQTLTEFSRFFHTSIDYLVGNTEDDSQHLCCDIEVSDPEKRHLLLYRGAPKELQQSVDQILIEYTQLLDQLEKEKECCKTTLTADRKKRG